MSNSDNFVNEMADELRRDRLMGALKRFGWVAAVVALCIAGGAAWVGWQGRSDDAAARALGDRLLAALDAGTPEARRAALDGAEVEGQQAALVALMQASDPEQDKAATVGALDRVLADATLPAAFRDLAALRKVLVSGADMPVDERRALLQPLTGPGQPFRPLAMEQLAYLDIETGQTQAAIDGLKSLLTDQQSPPDLRQRASQVITALGGSIAAG